MGKTSARVLFSRGTYFTSTEVNLFKLSWTRAQYSAKWSFLTWYLPRTWEATSCEFVKILTSLAPIPSAIRRPARKASYSAWLLEVGKERVRDTSTMIPSLFSKIISAPLLVELE